MGLSFETKAINLENLHGILKSAELLPQVRVNANDWVTQEKTASRPIFSKLGPGPYAVRSSCKKEDDINASNAGQYDSYLNVGELGLFDAIESVIRSYGELSIMDEVLIQPMLKDVSMSGVGFTHDPNSGAAYQRIDYWEGKNTEKVTSGSSKHSWRRAESSEKDIPKKFSAIVKLLDELFYLFDETPIDIEFAVTGSGENKKLWLLQVRPLVMKRAPENKLSQRLRLSEISKDIIKSMKKHPFLRGNKTVFGVMPDWNPAEILGLKPQPLALSLYREMITDTIWAYQRHNYGYRNLRSFPLMRHFYGLPYIDVRVSFNSFIPATLEDDLANKLVDYYLQELCSHPQLHDKVEFEIVLSCYTLDIDNRLQKLRLNGFLDVELDNIKNSLRILTNGIVNTNNGLWALDTKKLDQLEDRRKELLSSSLSGLEKAYWLIEDGKRYGTLPFAGLARAGFVAMQLLQSLVTREVFDQEDYSRFLSSVSTVSKELTRDRQTLKSKKFIEKYGHLRPGTYDILSSTYGSDPSVYFDWKTEKVKMECDSDFSVTLDQLNKIGKILREEQLELDAVSLLQFIKVGIEQRELAKFRFTRNLSMAIEEIAKFGRDLGISREDLAYCDITILKDNSFCSFDPANIMRIIEIGKSNYEQTLLTSLPPLITKEDDVWSFEVPEAAPNFITQQKTIGQPRTHLEHNSLDEAIVCIPNADPGFDWIFSKPIRGLITAWGGANSHMAIRAGELGIPAVIGAGEINFENWSQAYQLQLDCLNKRVDIFQ